MSDNGSSDGDRPMSPATAQQLIVENSLIELMKDDDEVPVKQHQQPTEMAAASNEEEEDGAWGGIAAGAVASVNMNTEQVLADAFNAIAIDNGPNAFRPNVVGEGGLYFSGLDAMAMSGAYNDNNGQNSSALPTTTPAMALAPANTHYLFPACDSNGNAPISFSTGMQPPAPVEYAAPAVAAIPTVRTPYSVL